MKIHLIRRNYSQSGGAEKYLCRLAQGIASQGHAPSLITSTKWPEEAWQWGQQHIIAGRNPMEFANAFRVLKPKLENSITFSMERVWGADIYRAGDGVHKAWLQRLNAQSSALSRFIRMNKRKHRQILALEESLFSPPSQTRIIANSQLVADEIQSFYNTEAHRLSVIHNGYDPPPFSEEERGAARHAKRRELQLDHDEVMLLFVGSGWKRKGVALCGQAMEQLANHKIKLVIAGKGRPRIHDSNIIYLGEVKNPVDLYLAADIFILPTLYDPFSNATLEAACHGLPIITTRDNGFSEVLASHGGGTIIDQTNDVAALCAAIMKWLDPKKRMQVKANLAQIAKLHTQKRNLQQTLDFILP